MREIAEHASETRLVCVKGERRSSVDSINNAYVGDNALGCVCILCIPGSCVFSSSARRPLATQQNLGGLVNKRLFQGVWCGTRRLHEPELCNELTGHARIYVCRLC